MTTATKQYCKNCDNTWELSQMVLIPGQSRAYRVCPSCWRQACMDNPSLEPSRLRLLRLYNREKQVRAVFEESQRVLSQPEAQMADYLQSIGVDVEFAEPEPRGLIGHRHPYLN